MANSTTIIDAVPLSRVFLWLENPRHAATSNENEAIDVLCKNENVVILARDIVKHGLSPLDRFGLVPNSGRKAKGAPVSYYAAEGNRRLCALKLLADPDRAPAPLRKTFEKMAEGWSPIKEIPAAVFATADEVRVWLDRVHSGPQGGIGRKPWDADQKQRFYGGSKNMLAMSVLDYAEAEGMITASEREGKLTTAQRFLNNPIFRESLGLDATGGEDLARTRPKPDFDALTKRFVRDLVEGKTVTSRMNKPAILDYARTLNAVKDVSTTRISAEPLAAGSPPTKKKVRHLPKKPEKARHIQYEQEIGLALKALANGKLESLYFSITSIELEHHVPLISVGAWAFMETLSARAGRRDNVPFKDYFTKERLQGYGIKGETLSLKNAIARLSEYGNSTKHHPVSATFNGDQLNNDMIALKDVILGCITAGQASASKA